MIVVKTRLRKMPKSCSACGYYTSAVNSFFLQPACKAIAGYPEGKILSVFYAKYTSAYIIQPTKERPLWCPLKDINVAAFAAQEGEQNA